MDRCWVDRFNDLVEDAGGSDRVVCEGDANGDETVRVWDFVTGDSLLVLRGHRYAVASVTVTQDGRWIVSGSVDRSARIWDTSQDYQR